MTELEYYKTRNRILDDEIVDLYDELYDLNAAYERKCEEVEDAREDYISDISGINALLSSVTSVFNILQSRYYQVSK